MLNRIEWDKSKVQADVFSLEGLIAWLEKQPGETEYNWYDIHGCLVCQYLDAMSVPEHGCHPLDMVFRSHEDYREVGGTYPWTFGAALERARKLASSPVQP